MYSSVLPLTERRSLLQLAMLEDRKEYQFIHVRLNASKKSTVKQEYLKFCTSVESIFFQLHVFITSL